MYSDKFIYSCHTLPRFRSELSLTRPTQLIYQQTDLFGQASSSLRTRTAVRQRGPTRITSIYLDLHNSHSFITISLPIRARLQRRLTSKIRADVNEKNYAISSPLIRNASCYFVCVNVNSARTLFFSTTALNLSTPLNYFHLRPLSVCETLTRLKITLYYLRSNSSIVQSSKYPSAVLVTVRFGFFIFFLTFFIPPKLSQFINNNAYINGISFFLRIILTFLSRISPLPIINRGGESYFTRI